MYSIFRQQIYLYSLWICVLCWIKNITNFITLAVWLLVNFFVSSLFFIFVTLVFGENKSILYTDESTSLTDTTCQTANKILAKTLSSLPLKHKHNTGDTNQKTASAKYLVEVISSVILCNVHKLKNWFQCRMLLVCNISNACLAVLSLNIIIKNEISLKKAPLVWRRIRISLSVANKQACKHLHSPSLKITTFKRSVNCRKRTEITSKKYFASSESVNVENRWFLLRIVLSNQI